MRAATLLAALALLAALVPAFAQATPRTLEVSTAPGHYHSIQAAVDAAVPGDTILVHDGVYQEAVEVATPRITIAGASRAGVVLDGGLALGNGITVTANGVTVRTLTVQRYAANGVVFTHVDGFLMTDITALDNGEYGLYAIHSRNGEISHSFGSGHGDSAFYLGETNRCECRVHHNVATGNMLGYSGTANSHIRIDHNEFYGNRAGILMSVLPNEITVDDDGTLYGTQVRTEIDNNYVHHNNNKNVPEKGIWRTVHVPVGEGITIAGGWFNDVHHNVLEENGLWGVGIFWLTAPPRGNHVHDNVITGGRFGIWWDEWGEDHCFGNNAITDVRVESDPATLPTCPGLAGDLPCPPEASDWAACRASDVRAPRLDKDAWLAYRALHDLDPDEDP